MIRAARAVPIALLGLMAAAGCRSRVTPPEPQPPAPSPPPAPPPTAPTLLPDELLPAPPPPPAAPPPAPAPRVPVSIIPGPNEPFMRVGLIVDRDSATVGATGSFRLTNTNNQQLAAFDAGAELVIRAGDGTRALRITRRGSSDPVFIQGPVRLAPDVPDDYVLVGGRRYRGDLILQRGTAGITIVNRAYMEQYLASVVALELGFRAPSDREAVKAQAVAARTYALRFQRRREALGFDVFPTDADQVYGGVDTEFPEVTAAVLSTTGEILVYDGRPIEALFHSTCGWSTEASEQVFQNRAQTPYLRAVSDRFGDGDRDFYCAISPRFRWREEWDGTGLAAILARTLPAILRGQSFSGVVTDIRATRTTTTGRVSELTVTTTNGQYTIGNGRIREALRPTPDRQLWSAMFQLYVDKGSDGRVTRVIAAGAGYGHGVGMCQFGAVGRARAGADYRSILATYYNGTSLERRY